MYHVELRQFPHNFCRFNLSERELRETIIDGWARGEWIELGERKWSPHQANLTVLEGPRLAVEQLSMGRGWRNAGRQGRDVTEQLLATARLDASIPSDTATEAQVGSNAWERSTATEREGVQGAAADIAPALDMRLAADSLGLVALARLGEEPVPFTVVWQLARERYPERSASDCLKLAEHVIRSLAELELVVILVMQPSGEVEPCGSSKQVERVLYAIDSWSSIEGSSSVLIRRH